MKIFLRSAVIAAAAFAATPALAADSFTSFNGVNGNGGFTYGYTDGVTLTLFDTNGNCALNGPSTCLHPSFANLPQGSVGGTFPTVTVPAAAVLLHPGDTDAQSVYSAFTASKTSNYAYTINLQSVGIDTTNGVGYTPFTSIGGVVTLGSRNLLSTYLSTASVAGTQVLGSGQSFGIIIDRNGSYFGDSTSLDFTIGAVPEPTTWALMLAGFGMVGAGIRSRKRQEAKVTFA